MNYNKIKKELGSFVRNSKKYSPVLAVSILLLTQALLFGFVFTQPITEDNYSSVSAQNSNIIYTADTQGTAYKIDSSTMSTISTQSLSSGGRGIDVSEEHVYVGDNGGTLEKIDKDTFSQQSTVSVGYQISGVFYSSGYVYTHGYSGQITQFNSENLTQTATGSGKGRTFGSDSFSEYDGDVYLVEEVGTSDGMRVQKITQDSFSVTQIYDSGGRPPREARGITTNTDGIFISAYEDAGADTNAVYKLDLNGNFVNKNTVNADRASGSIRTLDNGNIRYITVTGVYDYDSSLTLQNSYSPSTGGSDGPRMGVDSLGNTYISPTSSTITKYNQTFSSQGSVTLSDTPVDILTDRDYTVEPTKFDPGLEIDTNNYLKHNTSTPYEVYYTNPDNGSTYEVTNDSGLTVNSSNTSVFTLNQSANLVVATSNTSVNEKENVTAEYEGLQTQENITVANATVDNLEILPGVTRVEATYTDSNIVLILIGTMLGVVATRASSAFAGIATIQLVLVTGFFVDLISLGVVLVGLFGALFIGLNLAANIDYTVRG